MLVLAFGFLAICAALEYRARGEPALRPDRSTDRIWRATGTLAGFLAAFGPLVVMARVDLAQGAGAYLLGAAFAFAAGFTPERWWGMTSMAAGIFGLGLLGGALLG